MPATQKHKVIGIATPLGEDVLLLRSAVLTEELGRPFQVDAELLSDQDYGINFEDMVGVNVTLRLNLVDESESIRYFNGYVSRFVQLSNEGNFARYQATIVPWLWFLTRTSDCRIFQEKKVSDIIEDVFKALGFSDYELRLSGTYPVLEYCVQYRETDFNFVSRLMEQEGIYYFFVHENEKHTLVLTDSYSGHEPYPSYEEIIYRPPSESIPDRQCITSWSLEQSVQPGAYVLNDFDFKKIKTSLLSNSVIARQHAASDYEIFDYPGGYVVAGDGTNYAKARIEELQAQHTLVNGEATARGIAAGYLFTLKDYPREDQNREFLATRVSLRMDSGKYETAGDSGDKGFVECHFKGMESDTPFRTLRQTRKPLIQGPQTAIVVGPSGEEIHTDEFGRIKVMFHWDRYAKADDTSSCWIRVTQAWAGKSWGAFYLPRIGQEVVVEFLEGDPDRPIVTGRVYNGEAKPPYALPAEKTKSTLKSSSSKGGDGFNEFRFEDKKGEEQIFIHAEKDQEVRVKNDQKEWIGNDAHLIVKNDQFATIENNSHATVKGNALSKIEGDHGETVVGNHHSQVDGADHLIVKGDHFSKIDGDVNLKFAKNLNTEAGSKVSLKTGQDYHVKSGANYGLDAAQAIHIKGGMTVVIEAGTQVSLKAGPSFVDIGPSGVAISGPMVMINSGGAAGSGGGSSPTAPAAAEPPDPPEAAVEAVDEVAGKVSEPPAAPTPPEKPQLSSAAKVLYSAAEDGTPFCEECARAAEVDVVEEEEAAISSIAWLDGADDKEVSSAVQWTNLPKEDKWVDPQNGVASKDRLGQKVRYKVKFSLPGAHKFKVKVEPGDDNQVYTSGETGRNAKFKFMEEEKEYTTDGDGTKIVDGDFFTTCAGLESYKLVAEDEFNNPTVETGELKTKRLVYAVVVKMKDMTTHADLSGMKSEFRKHGIEIVELDPVEMERMANIGPDEEDEYKRKLKAAFQASKGKAKSPYAICVGFTEHLAAKNPNQVMTVPKVKGGSLGRGSQNIPIMAPSLVGGGVVGTRYLWKDMVPGESWFVSAQFIPDEGGSPVTIPESACKPYSSSGTTMFRRVKVDVSGLPDKIGTIKLKVNVVDRFRGGLSIGGGNLICICTKAYWDAFGKPGQVATIIHEMGHKVGMVSDGTGKLPDKVETYYEGKGHKGPHCHFGLPVRTTYADITVQKCVMFGAVPQTDPESAFCEKCAPAMVKLDLSEGWTP